jgi:DNA-binding IclR family transcriptional regulator
MTTYRRIEALKVTEGILNYLSAQRDPVSGQDIAKALDTPHATCMCHLATLADMGWVQTVGGYYELGMRLALLWARYRRRTQGKIDTMNGHLAELECA